MSEDTVIRRRTLFIAMDETGNEDFKADEPIFGFGGVAGFGVQLARADKAWRQLRESSIFGVDYLPMHASGSPLSTTQIAAISDFFRKFRLPRFAFIVRDPILKPPNTNALQILKGYLIQELVEFIEHLPKLPNEIVLGFEFSERLLPKLMNELDGFSISYMDQEIPIILMCTLKSASSSAFEMADFILNRAQRQYKASRRGEPLNDAFVAMFPSAECKYSKYVEMRVASFEGATWKVGFPTEKTFKWTLSGSNPFLKD